MAKEIETKILNIDPARTRDLLAKAGAKKQSGLSKQRRYVFDIKAGDESRWIRLREANGKTTLAVKIINSDDIDGTEEYETEVADLEQTQAILKQLGFTPKSYQENYREAYSLGPAEVSIDYWPGLKPYLEVEAQNEDDVEEALKQLNLGQSPRTSVNTKQLYLDKSIDLDKLPELVFSEEEEKLIRQD